MSLHWPILLVSYPTLEQSPVIRKKRLIKWNVARFTRTGLQMFLVFLTRSEVSRLQSALVSDFWSGEPASRSFKEVVIVLIIKNENGV